MRRFKFYHEFQSRCDCTMEESPDGEYISYEDHMNEMAKFQLVIAKMENRIRSIKSLVIGGDE